MTMTIHPRPRAETIRIPLGFLILSLWKRPSSRTDFCPGSCDNPFPSSSYFITDNSTEPARSHFSALVIFLHMLACRHRRTKRRGANEEKVGGKRDAAVFYGHCGVSERCCKTSQADSMAARFVQAETTGSPVTVDGILFDPAGPFQTFS
ncbi:hypothetical protein ILYODFUR_029746 [Ilyodon furcidens]|uniref:Uncharacterized protein n=1 Tax=Ilyodon furcidens TaxID=33524 RepID=A0ABV0VIH1_9TELE